MAKGVFKPDPNVSLLTKGPGHVATKSFENVLRNVLGDDPDEEMFSVARTKDGSVLPCLHLESFWFLVLKTRVRCTCTDRIAREPFAINRR